MKNKIWIGMDVGGTKISAGLFDQTSEIIGRTKFPTPPKAKPQQVVDVIKTVIKDLLLKNNIKQEQIQGIGIGIPGIVDNDQQNILATPNINLAGFPLVRQLKTNLKLRAVLGNDVNLGLLAEKWLGAGKGAKNVIGIFPGTGVGGGIIIDDKMVTGSQGAAAEIGHMILDVNGPLCNCGNRGCLEALTSRWAIERDIRQGIRGKEKTVIQQLTEGKLDQIKSGVLKEALRRRDPLTIKIMTKVAQNLGKGCISLKHIFNPDLIILGGGLIEACGDFILPILEKTVSADPFFREMNRCKIVVSQLGDDAVILGASLLAKGNIDPAKLAKKSVYPDIAFNRKGIFVKGKHIKDGLFIRADGKLKGIPILSDKNQRTDISLSDIEKFCRKKPKTFIVGRKGNNPGISPGAIRFLQKEKITWQILPLSQAVDSFLHNNGRKALVLVP